MDRDPHILAFVHVGEQVEITNVASCKLGVEGRDNTVEDELAVVRSAVGVDVLPAYDTFPRGIRKC